MDLCSNVDLYIFDIPIAWSFKACNIGICPMQLSQEKCSELIDFAAAELRDVNDGRSEMTCPVLNSLAVADRCKADPRML